MLKSRVLTAALTSMLVILSCGTPVIAANTSGATNGSIDLTNAPLKNEQVTPFTVVNVGGGTWDYGTSLYSLTKKKVWSNYLHPTKNHHSSCSIGANMSSSGVVAPKSTSFSSAVGDLNDSTQAYWGVD